MTSKESFLFRCNSFGNVSGSEINVHKDYNFIEIKHNSSYHKYDPFVSAKQALQFYYASYPSLKRNKRNRLTVFKLKATFTFDGKNIPNEQAYQADLEQNNKIIIIIDDHPDFGPLNYESNVLIEPFETTGENDVEYETESESENSED